MGQTDLESFFGTAKADLEERLRVIIEEHDEGGKLKYFLNSGKRLRPLLCLLTFHACNGTDYSRALDLAAAIELHHCASLVHDDIIDGDVQRRSEPSFYKRFGLEDAILTGHRAIVLGFKCVLNHNAGIVRTLFDTWDQSLKGEIEDIHSRKNSLSPTAAALANQAYFEVIVNKTASLFAGASKVGCQEANAPSSLHQMFYEYGKNIGVAYQLADDMQDVSGGKEMLPLAWIISRLDGGTEKVLAELTSGKGMSPYSALRELGVKTDSFFAKEIEAGVEAAEKIVQNSGFPDGRFKQMLLETPRYMVNKCMEN